VERIATLDGAGGGRRGADAELGHAAAHAAVAVHARGRVQQNQLARLRRRGFEVVPLPFVWRAAMDREAVGELAHQLERRIAPT
jgi:hypothetical protein